MASSFRCPNLLCKYADPAFRASLNVRYAPITDPAVATAAYSYHGLRWLAARIAVKMSGPPNVGSGELSTMARENSPNAPKWRNIEVTPWPQRGVASWRKMFNTNSLYQLRWTGSWGAAVPPVPAMPCDSQSNCEPKKVPSNEPQERLLPQSSRDGKRLSARGER